MSALGSADLHTSAGGNLTPQTDQPVGRNVFRPLYKGLKVDEKLKLSSENFFQSIDDFFRHKNITTVNQLTATPPFPTPHVLAKFASKAYRGYKKRETDNQYETRLDLPDGWKLLTTASNITKTNGYFGAAYWHPEHQQVVIAHRGTKPTNIGALWTDLKGVVHNEYVPQMKSASTFAHKVVEVLREVRREYGVSFQLFFTGHSLGGWLAQVTTFTTEYLKTEGNIFLRSIDDNDSYHPHTVVFDSPGCKDMLLQMTDKLDVLYDGRSIDIEHLDITSYLSAPNRINTCKKHVGTLYRIFPDLSDMGMLEKHTPLYNLETHSMDNIVQAFDPATGQVYKNEQSLLKLQVVVDWPVSTGLKGGEDYERFFEWAKHFNNYHPNAKDVFFQLSHCNPIRYQTKIYDEGVNSFRIFSEEEQEFLEGYHRLRQWQEFFKPKELFSVVGDSQTQAVAEKILENFEIEKGKIRCTEASALQALIPYVKRLLQLFPGIKENTKHALSSDKFRNKVYQFETRRYVERINQSSLEFNSDALSFREFLESEQQKVLNLQMVRGDEWAGLIKVYKVLKNKGCLIEGQYTVLKLECLSTLNQLMDLSTLMQSTVTPYLLLMACEDNQQLDEETEDVITTLFDTIKQKPNIKVIFITRSEGSTVEFLHHVGKTIFRKGFVRSAEQLTWSELTSSSQEKLLEKSVKFQGAKISLNQLISAESPAAIFPHLGALLEEKELTIADPVPISEGYNESYYIGRTLRHQKTIKKDILNDEDIRVTDVYLARTEEEYTKLCQLHPTSKIHWLEKDKSGNHFWQQSKGSLETVRRYIDTESSHRYTADDLDKLLEQAQHQRVMLISDTAGMGKSTILTHMSKQIKQKFPTKWVARIDLNDHTDALNVLKALKEKQIDKEEVIEFVSEKLLKLKTGLEMELFKQCCEHIQKVRIVIMLDGFDEISPSYEETVIDLLQALRQTAVEQVWVTTRPHLRNELEDKLQQLSYTLEPFSEKDQVKFLTKFWRLQDWFTETEGKGKNNLAVYAEHLTKMLAKSTRDIEREFTGIPLQTRMLAEAFGNEVKMFYEKAESTPEFSFQLDLLGLYGKFIERKYDIYQKDKFRVQADNAVAIERRESDLKIMRKDHQLLALKVLFTDKEIAILESNSQCKVPVEQLTRLGIVQVRDDGKPYFIQRTFAEYCAAEYLVNRLNEWNNSSEQVQTFILKDIFLELKYKVIRVFIDGLLSRSNPSDEVLQQYGSRIHDLRNDCVLIFHRAVVECNVNIVAILLDSLQAAERTDSLVQLLLAKDDLERTVLHMAAVFGGLEILQKTWVWANEKLTIEEIKNTLLLSKDVEGRNVFQTAANWNRLKILQEVWEWANKKLTTDEINNNLLLATDQEGRSVFYMAAVFGGLEILEKVWEWAKEKLTTEEINNKLLLVTDDEGRTIFHVAANWSRPEILQKIWECANETLTREEINNKLLLATDSKGRTVLHMAAGRGSLEILQKVSEWANEKLTTEEINNNLLLATDDLGRTVLHMSAVFGGPEIIQKLREWAKETLTTDEINNKLLLATDYKGRTVFLMAADHGTLEILQRVWEWANETLTREEINNKLLLVTDKEGRTVFYMAAKYGAIEKLEKIWAWANKKLTTDEINNKLLLSKDVEGRNVLLMAAGKGRLEILQKVRGWAKEKLTDEINKKLLLATDNKGRTVFHMATKYGALEKLETIWDWANEKLTREEINDNLLLATDNKGRTVFYMAAERGRLEIYQKVWEYAKQKLTTEELQNNLLLGTDYEGRPSFTPQQSVAE